MRTCCIINNYNYQAFLADAVESALNQTTPFDEIVIVDDGSTDGSREIIGNRWSGDSRVRVVLKQNGGQLSAFNAGFEASTGDLLCFLDSDDVYYPDYLEKTLAFYRDHADCDFLYCGYDRFDAVNEKVVDYPERPDLGITAVQVNSRRTYLGGPTSTLSLKRETARKILPYPYPDEWPSRADDVLIWGASLVGAHKFFNAEVLVGYRVHAQNAWYGRRFTAATKYKRELAINRLFCHFRDAMGYGENLNALAYMEFRTHPAPDFALAKEYLALVSSGVPGFQTRLKNYSKIVAHYFAPAKRR